MSFDVLDQDTMDTLPPLEELHAAYGVQVNALGVNEFFGLYANRETGVIVSGFFKAVE